jgi:choline-sulfatase
VSEIKSPLNILFIMADQMTPALVGAYGHPVVQTPNLNRLAQAGVRFNNAYTPYPLCGPARAALAAGKYASRLGIYDNACLFHSDELTIAHYLTLAGYDCVASGKLHYVGPDQLHGFSRRLTTDIYPEDFRWLQNRDASRSSDPAMKGNHAAQYIAEAIRVEWHSNLAYDEAVAFHSEQYLRAKGQEKRLKAARNERYQPFLLFSSFHHPHDPFKPPRAYWDLYEDQPIDVPDYPDTLADSYSLLDQWLNEWHGVDRYDVRNPESLRTVRRAYYALVTYIDDKIGQLLQTLEESGLAQDTMIIFTSDHGDMLGEKGMVQKRTFYDWSAKVPLIIHSPETPIPGQQIEQPVSLLDLLPTLLELTGCEAALPHDGHSLVPLLNNKTSEAWDVYSESHAEGVYGTCFMLRAGQYKYNYIVYRETIDVQLFDMEADPGEWHNLAGQGPYQALEAELRNRLLAQFDPLEIEQAIQASIPRRKLLKRWTEAVGLSWSYHPKYDPDQRTLDQYLNG